jgi:hypothetical protein
MVTSLLLALAQTKGSSVMQNAPVEQKQSAPQQLPAQPLSQPAQQPAAK